MKWLACFAIALMAPTLAFAQVGAASPYTFTVPLQLDNVPEATSARVDCSVSRLGVGATGSFSTANLVASGSTTVAVAGGRYSGEVSVPTTWRMAGATGASYQCSYTLSGPSTGGGTFAAGTPEMYTRATGRRITSATAFAEGAIP